MSGSSNRPATLDFESRSTCDLRATGSWKYSLDPTTQVLCLAFRLPHWKSGRVALWHPAFPTLGIAEAACPELKDLFLWIAGGGLVEAHNAFFERGIWTNVMVPQYGWPPVPQDSWRCSAAKAAAHALPRALGEAVKALGLKVTKDLAGQKLMKKLSKPRNPRKAELAAWEAAGRPTLWWESKPWFEILWAYCQQDVRAEETLSATIPDLSPSETALYLLDQTINEVGVRFDRPAIDCALGLIAEETVRLNGEIATLTEGFITQVTQRQRLKIWLESEGLTLDNTQKQTIEDLLDGQTTFDGFGDLTPRTTRALEILRELGKSSTAKYEKMVDWVCPDGRIHGSLLFHGASTGRWTGAGVQPQNFPKGTLKPWDMDDAWLFLQHSLRDQILAQWGSVLAPLSQGLRGVIIPSVGKQLYVADYAAIEARVLLWLAGDEDALDIFREGRDIYCDFGSELYGRLITKSDIVERALSKIAVLGLGYQMGADKFFATCAAFGVVITEEFAQTVVNTYRAKYALVKQMWADQEAAAIQATERSGVPVVCGRITWLRERQFLYAILPSGRRLAYPFPQVKTVRTPWDTFRPQLSFMGVSAYNHQWGRQTTYGGSLVENCLAGNTPVLTSRGWRPLDTLQLSDRVWDGEEWVNHGGLIDHGWHATCILDGIVITPDHRVLTSVGWAYAKDVHTQKLDWALCRRPRYFRALRTAWWALVVARNMLNWSSTDVSVTGYSDDGRSVPALSSSSGEDVASAPRNLGRHQIPLLQQQCSGLSKLRWAWDSGLRQVARIIRQLLGGHGTDLPKRSDDRSNQQRWSIRSRKLPVGNNAATGAQHQQTPTQKTVSEVSESTRAWATGHIQSVLSGPRTRVYDLRNCGPRQRFVVAGGRMVHNCTQAVARDFMAHAMQTLQASGVYQPILTVHDELVAEAHPVVGSVENFVALVSVLPHWGASCPIEAEGWTGARYRK